MSVAESSRRLKASTYPKRDVICSFTDNGQLSRRMNRTVALLLLIKEAAVEKHEENSEA
jgi:hypothetical protein